MDRERGSQGVGSGAHLFLVILRKVTGVSLIDRHAVVKVDRLCKELLALFIPALLHAQNLVFLERIHGHRADERNVNSEASTSPPKTS